MKKFNIEKIGPLCERLGSWEVPNTSKSICSPGVWLTTSACGVPHLTPESFNMAQIHHFFAGYLVSYERHARSIDVYQAYGKGFNSFCGLPKALVLLTIKDPQLESKSGYNTAQTISVWGESQQRETVDVHQYWTGVQALKPDIFVSLCDADIPKDSTTKRAQKATKFTQNSVETLVNNNSDLKMLHIGPLEGGYLENLRKNNAQWLAQQLLDGFLLDGFHSNGKTSLEVNMNSVSDILQNQVLPYLPKNAPRFYFGMIGPHEILKLIQSGVDFFETSYAFNQTELGHALTFTNTLEEKALNEDLPNSLPYEEIQIKSDLYIDLNSSEYKNDFGPILKSCACYTCRRHTRGYINHLLATKELLAGVLLNIHNLHHLGTFFQTIRESIANDVFEQFVEKIEAFKR